MKKQRVLQCLGYVSNLVKTSVFVMVIFISAVPAYSDQGSQTPVLTRIEQINSVYPPGVTRAEAVNKHIRGLSIPQLTLAIDDVNAWHVAARVMKSEAKNQGELKAEFNSATKSPTFRNQINAAISNYILNTYR